MSGNKYEVVYFNGRGRAELARLCLSYAGQKFEDTRIDSAKWPEMKASAELMVPYLPVLKVDGTVLQETCLIGQYIGEQHGFGGDSAIEKHLVCSMTFYIESIFTKAANDIFFEKDEAKKAENLKNFSETFMPLALGKLASQASKNGNGVLFGSNITVADIHLYYVMTILKATAPGILDSVPSIAAIVNKVGASPKIAEWVASRPETPW